MAAEVESMFSVRAVPWDGVGTDVSEAKNSDEAIKLAGLDWKVTKRRLKDAESDALISPEFVATVRESDGKVLGIVNDSRYQVVQNSDGFEFTNKILGDGTRYETAGSLFGGRKVWLMAKIPSYYILGDEYIPYLVFTNSHDGTGAVRVAVTPVRVVCNNTLNFALDHAARSWACNHRGDLRESLHEASKTLALTNKYMQRLEKCMEGASKIPVDKDKVIKYLSYLLPINKEDSKRKNEHIMNMREDIIFRWENAPDLSEIGDNGYKFLNAVSDFAVHTEHHRDTKNFKENLFGKVVTGHGLYIDKAYEILMKAS